MAYTSTVASIQLAKTPMGLIENWPFALFFAGTNAIAEQLFGDGPAFLPGTSFWDSDRLRQTMLFSVYQGLHDVVNFNIWRNGYAIPPPPDVNLSSGQPQVNVYY